jgi:CarD family transcriptional regulator
LYKVGDKVVYPHHGAGTVVKREKREVLGEKREYLTIKILHNDMTVNVPADNAERVGLRKVIDEEAVKKVVKYLTSGGTEMPKNWNRRFKHNRDKMKTGDIYELAEVVRNLALRDGEKGLSTGEKQMYVKAKKILASELMYAKTMSEDEALEWLEETLTDGVKPKLTPAEKAAAKKAPAKKVAAAPVAKAAAPSKAPVRPAPKKAVANGAVAQKAVAAKTSPGRKAVAAGKAVPAKSKAAATAKVPAAAGKPAVKKKTAAASR